MNYLNYKKFAQIVKNTLYIKVKVIFGKTKKCGDCFDI